MSAPIESDLANFLIMAKIYNEREIARIKAEQQSLAKNKRIPYGHERFEYMCELLADRKLILLKMKQYNHVDIKKERYIGHGTIGNH